MAFFDDFAMGIKGYPAASVTLSIGSLVVQPPGTAGVVNVNEVWAFKITVTNNGDLNMKNVTLHFDGLNGATVATSAAGPFSTGILTTAAIASVPAHSSVTTGNYFFKAPATSTAAAVALVNVHVNTWDADLNYLLANLSGHANPPEKVHSAQVFP